MMQIKIDVREEEHGLYSIYLTLSGSGAEDHAILLQTGYATSAQALQAIFEVMTYAAPEPPDLSMYDAGIAKLGELLDAVAALEDAMHQVGTRLNAMEDVIGQLVPAPQAAGRRSLLPERAGAGVMVPIQPPAPPKIRRSPVTMPHEPSGGAFRPGQGEPE